MTIKAIETRYKGYRFRSRLEARWAVFFDAVGLRWEYEPEGFDLGDAGWYLPDFYLVDLDAWVEIKSSAGVKDGVFRQLVGLIESGVAKPHRAWGFFGDPLDHEWVMPCWYESWPKGGGPGWYNEWAGASVEFHRYGDQWEALPGFGLKAASAFLEHAGKTSPGMYIVNYNEKCKARAARFEHGECG